jgi:NADH-quinone oxidoreductase subunit J
MTLQLLAIIFFGLIAIWFAMRVFMTQSMVRSAFSLLASMAAIGALMLAMEAEFLGVLQLMMMAGEMSIMAIFMMMYMMDPGGMEGMDMTHQKKAAKIIAVCGGGLVLLLIAVSGLSTVVPAAPAAAEQLRMLGEEIMMRSMLLFETAGVAILTTMVAATSLALVRGRSKENQ